MNITHDLLQTPTIRRHHRVVTIQKVVERTAENQGKQARRLLYLDRERGPTSVVNRNLVEEKEERRIDQERVLHRVCNKV
jgi:hypothetical protein